MPVDRFDDALQDRAKDFATKGPEEVGNREIVGHPELRYVGDNDLYVPASVPTSSRRQAGASDVG